MSEQRLLTPEKSKNQLSEKPADSKRGVSATFIAWLLDGFTQLETAKVKIENR